MLIHNQSRTSRPAPRIISLPWTDYAALKNTNSIMAPLLFYTFFSTVFFILLNMFLAIVNDSYMVVKSSQTEADLNFYRNMTKQFKTKLTQ